MICVILGVSYFNTYINSYNEGFDSKNEKTIILLGDSIFKNNAYVSNGKGIDELLLERTNGKSYCYAVDNSKIIDVYSQINEIPIELDNESTTIFLSVGGNDILSQFTDKEDVTDTNILITIFGAYKKLIKSIQSKMPHTNIVLLDIYYPDNIKYKQYHNIINKWNTMIYDYASNSSNHISSVIKISNILTQGDDFSLDIEPSYTGGKKIVETIINNY